MDSSASTGGAAPHVVLVASPGAGHLIPMAELARRLVAHHGLAATLVTFTDLSSAPAAAQASVLASLAAADVATSLLPPVPLDDLPAGTHVETQILALIHRSIPHLRALLQDVASSSPLAALVPDFFCSAALPLAAELGVQGYLFFPSNLTALAIMRRAVELNDDVVAGEYRALPDLLELPGHVSLRREDFPDGLGDGDAGVYASYVDEGRLYRAAAGFLVNTFYEMEPANVEDFRNAAECGAFPPAYPVGPFVRSSSSADDVTGRESAAACVIIDWLDRQRNGSVVYVLFGSSGALSVAQRAELAAGLESCGHMFLWVVRMSSLDGNHCSMGKAAVATRTTTR